MGSKWNETENALLDHLYGGPNLTRPATIYMALYSVAPTDAGGGTEVSTVGTGYVRLAIDNEDPSVWENAAGGAIQNASVLRFAQAILDWGTIVAWGFFDAVTAGNRYGHWGEVTPNKVVSALDTPEFAIGDLDITED